MTVKLAEKQAMKLHGAELLRGKWRERRVALVHDSPCVGSAVSLGLCESFVRS